MLQADNKAAPFSCFNLRTASWDFKFHYFYKFFKLTFEIFMKNNKIFYTSYALGLNCLINLNSIYSLLSILYENASVLFQVHLCFSLWSSSQCRPTPYLVKVNCKNYIKYCIKQIFHTQMGQFICFIYFVCLED